MTVKTFHIDLASEEEDAAAPDSRSLPRLSSAFTGPEEVATHDGKSDATPDSTSGTGNVLVSDTKIIPAGGGGGTCAVDVFHTRGTLDPSSFPRGLPPPVVVVVVVVVVLVVAVVVVVVEEEVGRQKERVGSVEATRVGDHQCGFSTCQKKEDDGGSSAFATVPVGRDRWDTEEEEDDEKGTPGGPRRLLSSFVGPSEGEEEVVVGGGGSTRGIQIDSDKEETLLGSVSPFGCCRTC